MQADDTDDADDVDYEFDDKEIDVEDRVAGDDVSENDADDPVNDDSDIESAVDMDTLREGIDEACEEIENADGDVVARERGIEGLASHSEGQYECVVCGAATNSEHGAKSHFGRKHPDGGESADAVVTPDDDGDDVDWNDLDIDSGNDDGDGDGDGENDSDGDWDAVRDTYAAASVGSSPAKKADARDAAVKALEAETDWMSIIERCNETTYDLWHLTGDGWEDDGYKHCETRLRDELGSVATDTEVRHIVAQLATANYVEQENTNARHLDETLVPVLNGVINVDDIEYDEDTRTTDWESVEVQDMEPNRHRFLYRVQTEWDPENADIEGLDEWLTTITRNDEARRIIWEFSGHSLHPRYPVDGFMVLLGDGGSGKSQTLEVLKAMLGSENTSVKTMSAVQDERFAGKDVVDSRANINTELTGTKFSSIEKIKTYTAGEEDSVEGKGTAAYNSKNDATMMFASDDPPVFPANRALGRRVYPVEFPCAYVSDPNPENKFELQARPKLEVQAELQAGSRLKAALMRAVQGLVRILREGEFSSSKTPRERVEQYESYADPIRDSVRACLQPASDGVIESGDLERTFGAYMDAKGHEGKEMQQIWRVMQKIPELPVTKNRTRSFTPDDERHTLYEGIEFTEEALENWVPDSAYWDQYGGRPSDEEDVGDARSAVTVTELLGWEPKRMRDDAVAVTVPALFDDERTRDWKHQEGVVGGDDGETMRFESLGRHELDEGERYVIRDATVIPSEAENRLQLVPGQTEVFHIEDRDDDQDVAVEDAETGDSPAYTDDDDEGMPQADRVKELKNVIEARAGRTEGSGALTDRVIEDAEKRGIEESNAKREIERLKSQGGAYEPGPNRVATVSRGAE